MGWAARGRPSIVGWAARPLDADPGVETFQDIYFREAEERASKTLSPVLDTLRQDIEWFFEDAFADATVAFPITADLKFKNIRVSIERARLLVRTGDSDLNISLHREVMPGESYWQIEESFEMAQGHRCVVVVLAKIEESFEKAQGHRFVVVVLAKPWPGLELQEDDSGDDWFAAE
ncbi:hypothetical protein T484DRAFT_1840871 [Baffinella frigidus]|nr:hypothetical protein T484DRAFT_1840871 [Cryptophyta sp. CCMP2293]